jgi:hypothetical protein
VAAKVFDVSKLKVGNEVCVDSTMNMMKGCDFIGVVVENPSKTDVLGLPAKRQISVREKGKRKAMVIDAAWIRNRI